MAYTEYRFEFSYNKYVNGKILGCGIKVHQQRSGVMDQKDYDGVIDELQELYRNVNIIIADVRLTN